MAQSSNCASVRLGQFSVLDLASFMYRLSSLAQSVAVIIVNYTEFTGYRSQLRQAEWPSQAWASRLGLDLADFAAEAVGAERPFFD